MNNSPQPISILLSTYNGEIYLTEQLDSLIAQTHPHWVLYVRDDGSTDKTVEIIKEYAHKDHRIIPLQDPVAHRGPKDSFVWMLSQIESDFYMFCDQDDFWLPTKIEVSFNKIKDMSPTTPVLTCTDLQLADQHLGTLQESMWDAHKLTRLVDNPDGLKIATMFPGCTMLFNKKARDLALQETYPFPMHDSLISFVTAKQHGSIIPIHQALIKYRQHPHNVVGLYSGKERLLHKLATLRQVAVNNLSHYKMARNYLGASPLEYIALKAKHVLNNL